MGLRKRESNILTVVVPSHALLQPRSFSSGKNGVGEKPSLGVGKQEMQAGSITAMMKSAPSGLKLHIVRMLSYNNHTSAVQSATHSEVDGGEQLPVVHTL